MQEFMDALRDLHVSITYHGALECFARFDENEDGRITEEEFVRIYIEEMKASHARAYVSPYAQPPPPPPPPNTGVYPAPPPPNPQMRP